MRSPAIKPTSDLEAGPCTSPKHRFPHPKTSRPRRPAVPVLIEGVAVATSPRNRDTCWRARGATHRVEVGKCYLFHPAGYDALARRASVPADGALLRVLELNADTQCSAEAIDGTIALVMVASLREVR